METIIVYWGYKEDNGKENGSYYRVEGLWSPLSRWNRALGIF